MDIRDHEMIFWGSRKSTWRQERPYFKGLFTKFENFRDVPKLMALFMICAVTRGTIEWFKRSKILTSGCLESQFYIKKERFKGLLASSGSIVGLK